MMAFKRWIEKRFGIHLHTWLYTFGYDGFPIRKECLTCNKKVG